MRRLLGAVLLVLAVVEPAWAVTWGWLGVRIRDLSEQEMTPELLHEATDRIMAAITALLEDIRGAQAPAVRFDPHAAGVADIGNPNDPRNKNIPHEPETREEGDAS